MNPKYWLSFFSLAILLLSPFAEARVFSFKNSWVAAYLRGTGGLTQQWNEAYNGTSGNNTHFAEGVKYNFSGEFGFSFLVGEKGTIRFGLEGLESKPISTSGTSYSTSAKLMDVASTVTVFNPNVTLEGVITNSATSRLFGFLGAGYAMAKVNNSYSNNTAYGAAASFGEDWKSTSYSGVAGLGYEYYAFDNVTFSFEAGYRYMKFASLTYANDTTAIRGATTVAETSGSTVTDTYGSNVHLDMSGPFVGFMIRFFIPPLN